MKFFIRIIHIIFSKTNILVGGQAVIEGVMMRVPGFYATSVRKPDGNIESKREDFILQHRSNIEADASIFVNFEDKINLKTSFIYFSKKKVIEYPDIVSYLPSRFNIGINLDYNYNDAIGGFIHLNNITNSRKYIWQGYKEIGINLMIGFGYSF